MGRKILFITTDQMRYDALGCTGGRIARTPVVDALAAQGIVYDRAHGQNVVCMPARSTMITGQYVRTHGVWMNGVPLPADSPSVAALLHDNGYRTALIGKAHFEPWFGSRDRFYENRMAEIGENGPHRGFEHMELANHFALGHAHYDRWLAEHHPGALDGFYPLITKGGMNKSGGGDTSAIQVHPNPIARELYHTDWVADRTIAFLDQLSPDEDWFVWMSFPDPHHPWDPPATEVGRVPWRETDLPDAYPGSPGETARILEQKPRHWMDYFTGRKITNLEAPVGFVPADMTPDQVREINAYNHIENELIDEACGRVLARIEERGWHADTDVFFTTDHGELQGDFGLLFKGPYHVDSLMRLPMIWKPAPSAAVEPARVAAPVGQIDLAPTFCAIAGLPVPDWMESGSLPSSEAAARAQGRERALTEWDSDQFDATLHLRTIYRDGYLCTVYEASSMYEGTEGELYDLSIDPRQWTNLWDDPERKQLRSDLVADLYDSLPAARQQRERAAPV